MGGHVVYRLLDEQQRNNIATWTSLALSPSTVGKFENRRVIYKTFQLLLEYLKSCFRNKMDQSTHLDRTRDGLDHNLILLYQRLSSASFEWKEPLCVWVIMLFIGFQMNSSETIWLHGHLQRFLPSQWENLRIEKLYIKLFSYYLNT